MRGERANPPKRRSLRSFSSPHLMLKKGYLMSYRKRYFVNRLDSIEPIYLTNLTGRWVQCQYCGRTLLFTQLIRHKQVFHEDYNGSFILDFIK